MGRFYYIVYIKDNIQNSLHAMVISKPPLQWLKDKYRNTVITFFSEISEEDFIFYLNAAYDNKHSKNPKEIV